MEFRYEEEKIYLLDESRKTIGEIDIPKRDEKRIDITHVFVDESLRGQGYAQALMQTAYDYIKKQGKLIVAKCPYAIAWFKKHYECQDIVINVKTGPKV
ncbi:MAG TPA: GNAT family N-acetyltransferase [Bacillota bacterium]|nr:GNAT family N-acetyltransferase [Bacillota bacterium]HPF42463.1 GNAT family N-acetyltransferase [Bacillota bacterium]HPJ85770.1 GNAT family N-acetyltransferase [Bacillota bacterium]HPQ61593.1 GNAT family N-acetyltransferase [Bacillota bacterium]HRX91494.1 GNAT family N-acetyltransferase [Candidatus Izemoplasmatales bacterium]